MTDPNEPRNMGDPGTVRQGVLPWANPVAAEMERELVYSETARWALGLGEEQHVAPFPFNAVLAAFRLVWLLFRWVARVSLVGVRWFRSFVGGERRPF